MPVEPNSTANRLQLEQEIQSLRLELAAQRQQTERLQAEIALLQHRTQSGADEKSQAQWEAFLSAAAGPVAQLLLQAHLVESQGKPLAGRDVLLVARRLLRLLQDHGLEVVGQVGDSVAFDPGQHTPISAQEAPQPGQAVQIRLVGLTYRGKLLLKAAVSVQ